MKVLIGIAGLLNIMNGILVATGAMPSSAGWEATLWICLGIAILFKLKLENE